jgi:dienelactone hydrolase
MSEPWLRRLLASAFALLWSAAGGAQQVVHFPSLDTAATRLDGYLYRPADGGRHPGLVFLHGCGGLFSRAGGSINSREMDWAGRFTAAGYVVLMVDSLTPRQHGEMCSVSGFDAALYMTRPKDAYGALAYLHAQDFVDDEHVGVIGWSQGGGVVLYATGTPSAGRPAGLPPAYDFKAAVAFYPGSCSERRLGGAWTISIPLLVLTGADDLWTPLLPCQGLLGGAAARGAPVQLQVYPGAVHDFDWPNVPRREMPQYRTADGVVPVQATDPVARADALQRVPAFVARYLGR